MKNDREVIVFPESGIQTMLLLFRTQDDTGWKSLACVIITNNMWPSKDWFLSVGFWRQCVKERIEVQAGLDKRLMEGRMSFHCPLDPSFPSSIVITFWGWMNSSLHQTSYKSFLWESVPSSTSLFHLIAFTMLSVLWNIYNFAFPVWSDATGRLWWRHLIFIWRRAGEMGVLHSKEVRTNLLLELGAPTDISKQMQMALLSVNPYILLLATLLTHVCFQKEATKIH